MKSLHMTTSGARTLLIGLALLLATPLFGEVFAQTAPLEDVVAPQSTTTEAVVEQSPVDERWFRLERISGKVDVGDFVVGPGRTEIELTPGQTVVREISVTNRISDERTFQLEVEDIVGSADGSDAATLTGEGSPYSIKDYISFPKNTFTLKLGERARIPVTISIPPNAEPGGYYGSVFVSTVRNSEAPETNAPRSALVARIGSLFFITVPGDTKRSGETQEVSLIRDDWWYEAGPIDLGIVFENTGSVHLNPYGELSITNMFGEEVGYVELEPWFVLPESLRVREITWDREFLLGRYTVTTNVNRGYDDIVDTVTVSFWVLPWKIVGGVFLGLFIIIFGIRAFFRTFEFKRKG